MGIVEHSYGGSGWEWDVDKLRIRSPGFHLVSFDVIMDEGVGRVGVSLKVREGRFSRGRECSHPTPTTSTT